MKQNEKFTSVTLFFNGPWKGKEACIVVSLGYKDESGSHYQAIETHSNDKYTVLPTGERLLGDMWFSHGVNADGIVARITADQRTPGGRERFKVEVAFPDRSSIRVDQHWNWGVTKHGKDYAYAFDYETRESGMKYLNTSPVWYKPELAPIEPLFDEMTLTANNFAVHEKLDDLTDLVQSC